MSPKLNARSHKFRVNDALLDPHGTREIAPAEAKSSVGVLVSDWEFFANDFRYTNYRRMKLAAAAMILNARLKVNSPVLGSNDQKSRGRVACHSPLKLAAIHAKGNPGGQVSFLITCYTSSPFPNHRYLALARRQYYRAYEL
jgi:hypothetical protein